MANLVILSVCVGLSAFIGLFVYARNPKHIVNRLFGLLTLVFIAYPVTNYMSLQTDDRLLLIRLVIFCVTIAVTCLYYIVFFLDDQRKSLSKVQQAGVYVSVVIALLDLTPLVFSGLTEGVNPTPIPNILAPVFLVHFIVFPVFALMNIVRSLRRVQGYQRAQYLYLLLGMVPIVVFSPLTGFVMPVLFTNASLIGLSPLYALFFIAGVGVAILRYRFLDIRWVVARALAYGGALAALIALYIVVMLVVTNWLFGVEAPLGIEVQAALAVTMAVAALTFHKIMSFFARLTNRLFYQDAYEAQDFFNDFNEALVSTIELHKLLGSASDVVVKYLKAEYCVVGVKEATGMRYRVVGTIPRTYPNKEMGAVRHLMIQTRKSILVADDIGHEERKLKHFLIENDISILASLAHEINGQEQDLGYVVLGPKKSGNPYSEGDVKVLETAVNELILAIQNATRFEEIERFNAVLQEKVDEATKKLRRTNDRLRVLDQTKDDFISMASHQLRTPLTAIKGYVSMTLEGDAGPLNETQQKMLNQAFISSQRMAYLISDLLDVSRVKTGKFVIEPVECNLTRVVEEELQQLAESAKSRNLMLTYHKPENFPTLMLDETKLRQVIMNFVDNAIYYTPSGGRISVNLVENAHSVEFTVTDNGIGVPRHERHHLFTKFYRANNAKSARPDGTGLGLFMAKKVVIAQGGAIIFKSVENKGSTFGFTFPKAKLLPKPKTDPQPKVAAQV